MVHSTTSANGPGGPSPFASNVPLTHVWVPTWVEEWNYLTKREAEVKDPVCTRCRTTTETLSMYEDGPYPYLRTKVETARRVDSSVGK